MRHKPSYNSDGGLCDQVVCSCGWASNWYYDGMEYAYNRFLKHKQAAENNDAVALMLETGGCP